MSEFTETVYLRTKDRDAGVQWLEKSGLVGYVLEPRAGWLQVLPDFSGITEYSEKTEAFAHTSGLALDYCFAEDHLWAFVVYFDGEPLFGYECAFEVDEYTLDGIGVGDLADLLEVERAKLDKLLYDGDGEASIKDLVNNAAAFADLLALPNYAWASFDYAEAEGLSEYYVGPDADAVDDEEFRPVTRKMPVVPAPAAQEPVPPPRTASGEDAPWQALYNLANLFLKLMHEEELFELTFDTRLTRDRLTEGLTKAVMDTPVSSHEQVVKLWLDHLLNCPEIEDVFATDEEMLRVLERAMSELGQ